MRARYRGWCRPGDHRVNPGDEVSKYPGVGWAHPGCRAGRVREPVPAGGDRLDDWEAIEARRERERENSEYALGRADVERWRAERQVFGKELADAWAAEDEFNRFWKYGEDY